MIWPAQYEFQGRKIVDATLSGEKLTITLEDGERMVISNNGQDLQRIADDIAQAKCG